MINILIISDGKYGKRAIEKIKEKYPSAEIIFIEEKDPTKFIDDFSLDPSSEQKIKEAERIIANAAIFINLISFFLPHKEHKNT